MMQQMKCRQVKHRPTSAVGIAVTGTERNKSLLHTHGDDRRVRTAPSLRTAAKLRRLSHDDGSGTHKAEALS